MSQGQGGGQAPAQDDAFQSMLLGGVLIIVFLVMIWMGGHTLISRVALGIRQAELWVMSPLFGDAGAIARYLGTLDPAGVTFAHLKTILSATGEIVRWIISPAIIFVAVLLYLKSPKERFVKSYTMKSLAQQEQTLWPEISPVVNLDLVKGDITQGPWAVNMTEREFVRRHKLIENDVLNESATRDILVWQLGPRWAGPARLPVHARAIFAILATKIAGKSDESLRQARKLAASMAAGKPDYSWVSNAILAYGSHPLVTKVISRHAYVFTVMASMLQVARATGGVEASSLFIWLRPIDRRLWYTLNSTGRYSFCIEAAGIMAHWLAEKEIGMKIVPPMIDEAVTGLKAALEEYSEEDKEAMFY